MSIKMDDLSQNELLLGMDLEGAIFLLDSELDRTI